MFYGLSESATASSFSTGAWLLPLMGNVQNNSSQCQALSSFMNSPVFYLGILFYTVTWILILATLVALIRYLWKRAGHI